MQRHLALLVLLFLATPASGSTFNVTSGDCTTDVKTGLCVRSPNYPSSYGNNEACQITMSGAMILTATAFNTERNFDFLFI